MEEVETEVENMECLEDPGVEDTENLIDEKEDDPNWHCQMEEPTLIHLQLPLDIFLQQICNLACLAKF